MKNSSYLQVFDDFGFSPQEKNVCLWIVNGLTHKEAGARLGISEYTVRNYMHNAKFRLYASGHKTKTIPDFISMIITLAAKYE